MKLEFSHWENFCKIVKHNRRYYLDREYIETENGRRSANNIMHKITSEICNLEEMNCTLTKGSEVYRCRVNKTETIYSESELGTVPSKFARANRMSPAGVSMFYCAADRLTALKETADDSSMFGIGKF